MNQLAPFHVANLPLLVAAADAKAKARLRFLEFFVNQIRTSNTRRAYVFAETGHLA